MIDIPEKYEGLPESERLKSAQASFRAAASEFHRLVTACGRTLTPDAVEAGNRLREAQLKLQEAQAAFDAATGEPGLVGVTETVIATIRLLFLPELHSRVIDLLDRECGRNLAFCRDATAPELDRVRLAVLELSSGDLDRLAYWVGVAKRDWRDVLR